MKMDDCCRTCLSKNGLNRIFVSANKSLKCSKILHKITGLKIEMNDGFPQTMCTGCINFINECLLFRKKCKNTSKILLEQIRIKDEPNDDVVESCDKIFVDSEHINCKKKNTVTISRNLNKSGKSALNNGFNEVVDDVTVKNIPNYINTHNGSNLIAEDDDSNSSGNGYDVTVTVDRIETPSGNGFAEYEATIEDILKKPKDIIFENKKLKKNIQLDYNEVRKETKKVVKKEARREIKEEPMECKYCHKMVKSKCALNNHYKIHTGRNIVCEHCGKKFTSKRRLLIHCKGRHGYKKTDKCKFCDYRGSSLEMVKIHERLHTGERPYVCACGAAFHRRSSYLQHVPIHQAEKTVPCDECPALFKSVTLMKIHKNRHKTRRRRQLAAASEHVSLQRPA